MNLRKESARYWKELKRYWKDEWERVMRQPMYEFVCGWKQKL
jgi:hypothetical protein